jgi:hypothetical protein
MNRHKEGSKRNSRACDAVGRNHRMRATDIIEVTHEYYENLFYLLVCSDIICCICN